MTIGLHLRPPICFCTFELTATSAGFFLHINFEGGHRHSFPVSRHNTVVWKSQRNPLCLCGDEKFIADDFTKQNEDSEEVKTWVRTIKGPAGKIIHSFSTRPVCVLAATASNQNCCRSWDETFWFGPNFFCTVPFNSKRKEIPVILLWLYTVKVVVKHK